MESPSFFKSLKKLLFLTYLSFMILIQMLSLSVRFLHPSLVIEVSLTSSFLLITRPPLDLDLQTSSQVPKETL